MSLSEAVVEDTCGADAHREKADDEVREKIALFLQATEWRPRRVESVAGALLYSRHGALARFVMRLRAKRDCIATDTSHDHEYTDWDALERFVDEFVERTCESGAEAAPHSGIAFL